MKTLLACGLFVAMISGSAAAALTPGQKAQAEGFIRQFTAAEFDARQKAVDSLVALGADVAPLVKQAQAETKDNEMKLRCEMVLKALRAKFGAEAVDGPSAPAGQKVTQPVFDAAKITLDLKDAPLGEVLDALAQQSGNSRLDAKAFKDRAVTLSVKDMPYWQALDQALDQAGLIYATPWFRGASANLLAAKVKEPAIAAYAGPAVLWVDRITRTATVQKTLATRFDPMGAQIPAQRTLSIAMRLAVEDRIHSGGVAIRWTKAVAADGKDVLPKYAGNPLSGASQQLAFMDTEDGIKGPLSLEGFIRVTFFVGAVERRAEDVFAAKQTVGDEGLLLKNVFATRLNKSVQVALAVSGEASRVERISYDMPPGYGFALLDPEGKKYTATSWSRTGGDVVLGFPDVPEIAGKCALLLVVPANVETKEYPFSLKDVPVP